MNNFSNSWEAIANEFIKESNSYTFLTLLAEYEDEVNHHHFDFIK